MALLAVFQSVGGSGFRSYGCRPSPFSGPLASFLPRRHSGGVLSAAYSPDGRFIVTACDRRNRTPQIFVFVRETRLQKAQSQANEAAAHYYHRVLIDSEDGRRARRYLEERGLDRATLQDFQLGFAPAGWENLLRHLRERGNRQEEMLAAGLRTVGEREDRVRSDH